MVLVSRQVGFWLALLPVSAAFQTHGAAGRSVKRLKAGNSNGKRNIGLHAAPEPQGLWKALNELSPDIIAPANAIEDPFPGVGLSIDSLYGNLESRVDNAIKVTGPIRKAAEPVTETTKSSPVESVGGSDQLADSIAKASDQMAKTSERFSKAFDSAFGKATEPALQASSAPATQQASDSARQAVSEPAAKTVDHIVQGSDQIMQASEPIIKATQPAYQAAAPAVKTGIHTVIKPNDVMLQALEKNSGISNSINSAVHDSVEKAASALTFKTIDPALAKGEAYSLDMTGMFDSVKFDLDIPSPERIRFSTEQFKLTPEQIEAAKHTITELSQNYYATLDSYFKFSDLKQSVASGALINEAIARIISLTNDMVDSLDLEHNTGYYLSLVTFFWATTQRRDGEMYGRMISEQQIKTMESELEKTKSRAEEETTKKSNEVAELKEQMELLKSQVAMLTETANDVRDQLEKANAKKDTALYAETTKPPEPVRIKEQQTEAASKPAPKEQQTEAASEPAPEEQQTEAASEPAPEEQQTETASKPAPAEQSKMKGATKKAAAVATKPGKKKTVKVKGTRSQVSPKESVESNQNVVVPSDDDWSQLSESTLKRKTVKELTGYLSDKGLDVTDSDGKVLKKDHLVELVLSK